MSGETDRSSAEDSGPERELCPICGDPPGEGEYPHEFWLMAPRAVMLRPPGPHKTKLKSTAPPGGRGGRAQSQQTCGRLEE